MLTNAGWQAGGAQKLLTALSEFEPKWLSRDDQSAVKVGVYGKRSGNPNW